VKPIDYIYRFNPGSHSEGPLPADAEQARTRLEDGNRTFARWMGSCCSNADPDLSDESAYVVSCNGLEVGMPRKPGVAPKQSPFAIVVGCSDARVPTEMLFGQGFNDLFVIRVAGNVLGAECQGSIDYALATMSESVRILVVLGHSGCGAVTGAVDAYMKPLSYWSRASSNPLRSILQRVSASVRESANAIEEVLGANATSLPGYREALINTAVYVNAAQAAYDLRCEVERTGYRDVAVLYGVYDLVTSRVGLPADHGNLTSGAESTRLVHAPTDPQEFVTLAESIARHSLAAHTNGQLKHHEGNGVL